MGRSRKSHGKRSGKAAAAPSAPAAAAPASVAQRRHVWWLPLGVAVLVLVLLGIWWSRVPAPGVATTPVATVTSSSAQPTAALPPSHYVGAQTCAACHAKETQAWQSSHHALAMQVAEDKTVAGHFDGALKQDGSVASFFKRDHAYFVKTDGPDGKPGEFEVKYTFGVYPLQQYLVAFPDGRLQTLRAAWDARPAAEGGQHWFNLYPGERIDVHDTLHWTRLNQNWNYMCADCHSTNVQRNYDLASNTFKTSWSEINVACEACHGPGSRHLEWSKATDEKKRADPSMGLAIALDERKDMHWIPNPTTGNPVRSTTLASHREVETCAVCHSRRSIIAKDTAPTGRLMDTHDPVLLTEGRYHADGQQLDEVYVYASFLQSRMYAKGVTCSDCHDPHTGKTRAQGNALCESCHTPAVYDTAAHHMHKEGGAGSQCVACHMPSKNYMVINARPDHSIRVPRPDLTVQYGVPNACANCHADKGAQWAADAIAKAHGPERKGYQHFVEALDAARRGKPGAASLLTTLAGDASSPTIARATAVDELRHYASPDALPAIQTALGDADALMRAAALDALLAFPTDVRGPLAASLADDPVLDVRVKAGRALAGVPDAQLDANQRTARDRAFATYRQAQEAIADRPESHFDLGLVYVERGDTAAAEQAFRQALKLQPDFVPAYVNLSDMYRATGREEDAEKIVDEGLKVVPGNANLLHAKGLALIRQKQPKEALIWLERAHRAEPSNARFAYVYGVALDSAGQGEQARKLWEESLRTSPYDPSLLFAVAGAERDAGNKDKAREYAERLVAVAPRSRDAHELLQSLGGDNMPAFH
ncbi:MULTISPECIES: tetratricopeptide repeat protein [unclassified Dyella]|uniref:tetratricopeptide repeat protein n=1 Tax=unclassified Dyella TaxID=2634549 RepID=UPI000CB7CAE9|nr:MULTISPECIES: tetratricopeptide repeat protein [unclassified Dyella]MDR3445078.1 tetratricopeptide repeat protein [Dyella sp.]PMQ04965.1 TPR repeat-containing protein YrrB [Dyella sp. AD56]